MVGSVKLKTGDLITLKGFKKLSIQEKPVGMVVGRTYDGDILVNWTNQALADRFALKHIISNHKLELINDG